MSTKRKDRPEAPTAERVGIIRQHMARMDWGPEVRARLAREWNLSDHRVSELAGEASRSLRADPADVAALRAQLASTCEEIVRLALEERSETTGLRDLRAALDGVLLAAKFRGAAPPEAPLLAITAGGDDGASEANRLALVGRLLRLDVALAAGDFALARQLADEARDLTDPLRTLRLGPDGEAYDPHAAANGITAPALPAHYPTTTDEGLPQ